MSCIECVKKNEVPNCRQCDKEFVKRDIHFSLDEEEEQKEGIIKILAAIGIALGIVAVVASLIYWWAGV